MQKDDRAYLGHMFDAARECLRLLANVEKLRPLIPNL